ncbi:sugar nucleotide-binding protein [Prochlorococcus marinus]|nr:sugar nucleotide-binding protein [Prochlorococcus marinus]
MEKILTTNHKILLLGGSGNLGGAFKDAFENSCITYYSPDRKDLGDHLLGSVTKLLERGLFHVVINCISLNGVNQCNVSPLEAVIVNSLLPKLLCHYSDICGYKLFHFSTECVFDDSEQIISSSVFPKAPSTTYGATKLAGEFLPNKNLQLIRLPLLLSRKKNSQIVWKMVDMLEQNKPAKASTDVISTPIFVEDLVQRVLEMINSLLSFESVIHFSSDSRMSMYETVLLFARQNGIKPDFLSKGLDSDFESVEQKPLKLGLKATNEFCVLPALGEDSCCSQS